MLRSVCFAIALRDNSAMALALADLAIYAEPLNRKPLLRENANALEHYTASLGLVRERLDNTINTGYNEIIATVVAIAAYDVRKL